MAMKSCYVSMKKPYKLNKNVMYGIYLKTLQFNFLWFFSLFQCLEFN